jgi:hypothetical protein
MNTDQWYIRLYNRRHGGAQTARAQTSGSQTLRARLEHLSTPSSDRPSTSNNTSNTNSDSIFDTNSSPHNTTRASSNTIPHLPLGAVPPSLRRAQSHRHTLVDTPTSTCTHRRRAKLHKKNMDTPPIPLRSPLDHPVSVSRHARLCPLPPLGSSSKHC